VPAVGDPVGLVLDQSQDAELGPELWDDILASLSVYDSTATWDSATGVVEVTVAGTLPSYPRLSLSEAVLPGFSWSDYKLYKVEVHLSGDTEFLNEADLGTGIPHDGSGSLVGYLAGGDVTNFSLKFDGRAGPWALTLESVSIRPVLGNHATQPVSNSRPTYGETVDGTRYIEFDGLDDFIEIEVPAGGWSGTVVFGWVQGSYWANYELPAGTWAYPTQNGFPAFPDNKLVAVLFKADGGEMTDQEKEDALTYVQSKGAGSPEDWASKTNWQNSFYYQPITKLQSIPMTGATDSIRNFLFRNQLVSFDLSEYTSDVSAITSFQRAWQSSGGTLTSFNATPLATMQSGVTYGVDTFDNTWKDCSLDSASVESVLINIDASGALGSGVIDIGTDGSSLTTAAQNAITSLKTKGWDPVIDGVSQ